MSSPLIPGERDAYKAFTLIELLTVIAIIGVLAGITFGVMKGVQERASIQQARSELAALSTALEAYKRQYGDYPQTGGAGAPVAATSTAITTASACSKLFNALAGTLGPELDAYNGKAFVTLANFSLENTNLPSGAEVANAFVDPWGRRYIYYYKVADKTPPKTYTWTSSSYVLYSVGPDGADSPPDNAGTVNYDDGSNADNIYANR